MKKILILMLCLFICGCGSEMVSRNVVIDELDEDSSKLKLTMVGDALVHSPIYNFYRMGDTFDFNGLFTDIDSELEDSDLLYYNQESIIGGKSLGYSGYPRFNTPNEFGEAMITRGFNIVSRANNHTLDKGEAGVKNSCTFWIDHPHVLTSGSYCTPNERMIDNIHSKNGITYTLLSYTTSTNGLTKKNDYDVDIYSDELVKSDVERLRDKVDVLLVAMHWGDEYKNEPNDEQRRIAKYLASLGVDIVIGTHPHVVEPIEWIGDTLIIYSLGNFISNQSSEGDYNRLIELMVSVDIYKTTVNDKVHIDLKNLETELLYMYSSHYRDFKVIAFSKLDDNVLPNYKKKYDKYSRIVKKYDPNITVK